MKENKITVSSYGWTPARNPTFNLSVAFGDGPRRYADYTEVRMRIPGFLHDLAKLHGKCRLDEGELETVNSTVTKAFHSDTSVYASPFEFQRRRYKSGICTPNGMPIYINVTLAHGSSRYDCDRRIVELAATVEEAGRPKYEARGVKSWFSKMFCGLFFRKAA